MQFLGQTLKKHLACGTYAVALVCSLVLYQKSVNPQRVSVIHRQANVNLTLDLERAIAKYSEGAVLRRFYRTLVRVYPEKSSTEALRNFSGSAVFPTSR